LKSQETKMIEILNLQFQKMVLITYNLSFMGKPLIY